MSKVITCAAAIEPDAFFEHAVDAAVFATLNFNVTTGTEIDARSEFRAFLTDLPGARFYLYKATAKGGDVFDLGLVGAPDQPLATIPAVPPPGLAAEIFAWLDDRSNAPIPTKWVFDPVAQPGERDYRSVAATHLLDSAERWNAPLPQNAGLSRLLQFDKLHTGPEYVVVPCVGATVGVAGMPATIPDVLLDGDDCFVVAPGSIPDLDAEIRTTAIAQPAALSLIDQDTGFLAVTTDANGVPDTSRLADFLARLRERSGARLATVPQMLDIAWPGLAVDSKALLRRLRWRGLTGLLVTLDPVGVLLTMADRTTEGPVVTTLNAAIGDLLHKKDIEYSAALASLVTQWFKQNVKGCFTADSTDSASRIRFVRNVAGLFGFAEMLSLTAAPNEPPLKDIPKLLPLLLSLFAQFGIDDAASDGKFNEARKDKGWLEDLDSQLDRELGEALQQLEDEEGVERALLETMRFAGIDADGLAGTLPAGTLARDEAREIIAGLQRRIRGSRFNGSEAARNVHGLLFEAALIAEPDPAPDQSRHRATPDELDQRLATANWFAVRLGLVRGGAQPSKFEPIADGLPLVPLPLDQSDTDALLDQANTESLTARYADAYADIHERPVTMGRVVADQIPRPLPIQIAADQNKEDAKKFTITYNGVGLLVQRDQEPWAHANLAMLSIRNRPPRRGPTLHPILPQANDGHVRVILDYNGDPLARTKAAHAFVGQGDADGLDGFYTHDDPDGAELGAHSKLPALGYGHVYRVASYVASKSGALPRTVAAAALCWLPDETPDVPAGSFIARYPYWRTTAIGQVSLGDASGDAPDDDSALFAPFNSAIEGVTPLFRDYPRIGHAAAPANLTAFDLWRDRDGHGTVTMPLDATGVSWPLREFSWTEDVEAFEIELRGSEDESVPALASWQVTVTGKQFRGNLALELSLEAGHQLKCVLDLREASSAQTAVPNVTIPAPATDARLWIRCSMTVGQNGGAVSFPDPRAETGAGKNAAPGSGGFLLLAPDQAGFWKNGIASTARLSLSFPRMSFLDFDRWLNGKRLYEEADDTHGVLKTFWEGLHTLSLDPEIDAKTAALLGQLPDLAVTKLLLDLIPIDALDGSTSRPVSKTVSIRPLKNVLSGTDVRGNLTKLVADRQKTFSVVSGTSLEINLAAGKISIPKGMVAQLRVRPLVPSRYVDAGPLRAFDDNVPLWSVGRYVEAGEQYLIFDGPVLTIETMCGLFPSVELKYWVDLADEMLKVRAFGKERRYDLTLERPDKLGYNGWRQLGSVDVGTQRWRFLGRPLVKQVGGKQLGTFPVVNPGCPVRELPRAPDDVVDPFEEDVFGSFDMEDADTQSVTLRPQNTNILQSFHWETPSATMFRHRVVLRSRYAGAIRSTRDAQVTVSWNPASDKGLHLRVAMLADRTRLQLTRPQMRALMPLPSGVDAKAITPAVLAMLEERPLDYGGLAERIGAEIKTSLGYDLQGNGPVKALDARKEFGPDPRLSYMPTPESIAAGVVLETEGPVGLTFDSASSPTWANSALMLQPKLLQAGSVAATGFEEHFLSVSLRRYLDPAWTVVENGPFDLDSLPVADPWWCEVDPAAPESTLAWPGPDTPIATVSKSEQWVVSFNARFLHPDSTVMVDLARVDAVNGSRIAFMHQPLEGERNAFSVFLIQDRAYPIMLASVEWSLPKSPPPATGTTPPAPTLKIAPPPRYIAPVSASAGTAMYWARTGINSDLLRLKSKTDDTLETVNVTELSVRQLLVSKDPEWGIIQGDVLEKRWVRSGMSTHASPLNAHRHLGTIVTHSTKTIGRTLEQFDRARLLMGSTLQPLGSMPDQKLRIVEFEVPARVVAGGNNHIPEEFREASFDLKAILGDRAGKPPPAMLVFIRPLAGTLELGPVQALKLKLRGQLVGSDSVKEAAITLTSTGVVSAAMIVLDLDIPGKKFLASAVDLSGASHGLASGTLAAGWDGLEVLKLAQYEPSKNQIPLPGEHWADVSLLTYPSTNAPSSGLDATAIPLSFDWFFTNDADTTQVDARGNMLTAAASERVSVGSLRSMREAQARIVSVSPPISIMQ